MSVDSIFARAQLEGWIVANVGSKEGEELLAIVSDMIEAERDTIIETNAALRQSWMSSTTNRDVEMYSLRLSEALIKKWRGEPQKP